MSASLLPADARPPLDLRSLLPPLVPHQGSRPLCLPFAVAGVHCGARSQASATSPIALAAEALWCACVHSGNAGADGTTVEATGDALLWIGQPFETLWPYNALLGHGTEAPPPAAGVPPWLRATLRPLGLRHDGIEDDLEDTLALSQLLVLVLEVTDEFEFPDSSGEIALPSATAPFGDYHAVIVAGASNSPTTGDRRMLIRNSWGESWGSSGYAWLPIRYLAQFEVQAAAIG